MKTYWAKEIAKDIIKKRGRELTIATGISPSGPIHIGNMREVITADLIYRELMKLGAKVKFIYIEDDFDRLRKLYPFLPKKFEKYIGWPLSQIPDPMGEKDKTYADRFIEPFFKVLNILGIKVEKLSATKMYNSGLYTDTIQKALKNKKKIIDILERISGRKIPKNWSPYNPLCVKCGKIDEAIVIEEDLKNNKVKYKCTCGYTDWADFSKAQGKLAWRVDWPARWSFLPVDIEPFGKEHATVGGSYDTGKEICEKIYKHKAPYGIGYDLIYLTGTKGKMSSSKGNVISAEDFLKIVPPELLRYLFAINNFDKSMYVDPGEGLLHLINNYAILEDKYHNKKADEYEKSIYEACQIKKNGKIIIQAPFKHLVNIVQTANNNNQEIKRILLRTGFKSALKDETILNDQITRIKNWLSKYAPDKIKFSVLNKKSKTKLNSDQKKLLHKIAIFLEKEDYDAEILHNKIYDLGKELNLSPKQTFEPIYLSLIGKNYGPKAGWFIVLLDKKFVISRFLDISN